MTDKELLEKAAKAAGINRAMWDYEYCRLLGHMVTQAQMWNPLTDDGDALRLLVKLKMRVEPHPRWPYVAAFHSDVFGKFEEKHNDDPYAATRRAIVRAAAAIGEQL